MSGPNENGGDGFCDLGETVGDEVGEVLGFVPELGDDDADATELQQHPRCTLARAVFGAFLTSGAVVSRHAYRCPFCWVWYGCRPRAEAYPPTEDRACGACSGVFEAGRLAAIRAEVERALRDLERDVESSTDWMVFCREQLLTLARSYPRSVLDSRHSTAFRVGVWHLAERRRRRDVGLLAGSRRWLEATR